MIRINLLPDEYRKGERSSPKLFLATLAAVIMISCSFGWFGYTYFSELGELEASHVRVTEKLSQLTKHVDYYKKLDAEKTDFEVRLKAIAKIDGSRVLWSQVLDQFIDTVNSNDNYDRHLAWFKSMTVKDGDKKKGPEVSLPGWVQGDDLSKVANFYTDLEGADFSRYIKGKSLPNGNVNIDPKRLPQESLGFSLKWQFELPDKWEKIDAGKAKKGSEKKKGK